MKRKAPRGGSAVDVRGEHVGPIHRQQVRHQRGVIIKHGGIHAPELITERILEFFGQTAQEHLDVAGDDVRFQRAGGAFRRVYRAEDRMEDVILENFAETFQRPANATMEKPGSPLYSHNSASKDGRRSRESTSG